MALTNFDQIVERAKQSFRPQRVVIAGADSENILLGAFQAQDAGFATPILVGEEAKILPMLERLGLKDKPYRLVPTLPGGHVAQAAIDLINAGEGDVLMRGNTQTRDFLMPLLDKKNGLRTEKRLTHIDLVSMPEYPKLIAIGDVTDHAEWLPAQDDYIPEAEPEFGEGVERRKERILWMNAVGAKGAQEKEGQMAQLLLLSKAPPIRPMQLALALLRGDDCDIPAVTRVNNGELRQLAKSAMIEAELTQRGGQIIPHGTMLPLPLMEICGEIDETNHLAAKAAAGDRSALRECIEVDPALAGLDRLYVQDVVEKMIELHSDVISRLNEEEE